MLNKKIDIKGLYIGKSKESKETILLNDFKSNKNIKTLGIGTLGVGRATHINSNNISNQLP
ncbi:MULTISPECIES: hypothetical protein [Clostridium]|nr:MULTISPECIES: hypothetical protein [Clostridium]MDK0980761.1 hypothetical protein [Clostridium perfringens]MDU5108319.1 hypothetical protein [Clostridium sp.]